MELRDGSEWRGGADLGGLAIVGFGKNHASMQQFVIDVRSIFERSDLKFVLVFHTLKEASHVPPVPRMGRVEGSFLFELLDF